MPHDDETCDAWFARFLPTKECGETHRRITRDIWHKWISPVIGGRSIRTLTRDDGEDVRDKLDRALDSKIIQHTTARNAWGALTNVLKSAFAARDRSLRVLPAALHVGILPPKRGNSRQRPWLYPNEWRQFYACEAIDVALRTTCAVALYTGLRPGELRALTVNDVDLTARTITVSKSVDARTGLTKPPKTERGQRVVPIHPELAPLLEELVSQTDDRLVPYLLDEHKIAITFREALRTAGITRPRLFAENPASS